MLRTAREHRRVPDQALMVQQLLGRTVELLAPRCACPKRFRAEDSLSHLAHSFPAELGSMPFQMLYPSAPLVEATKEKLAARGSHPAATWNCQRLRNDGIGAMWMEPATGQRNITKPAFSCFLMCIWMHTLPEARPKR